VNKQTNKQTSKPFKNHSKGKKKAPRRRIAAMSAPSGSCRAVGVVESTAPWSSQAKQTVASLSNEQQQKHSQLQVKRTRWRSSAIEEA
jgi:hypothetical protein